MAWIWPCCQALGTQISISGFCQGRGRVWLRRMGGARCCLGRESSCRFPASFLVNVHLREHGFLSPPHSPFLQTHLEGKELV